MAWFDGDMSVVEIRRKLLGPPRQSCWSKLWNKIVTYWRGRV